MNKAIVFGVAAAAAGALRFLFSQFYPNYYLEYDLYPPSIQLVTSLTIVIGLMSMLAAWWFCCSGQYTGGQVALSITLTFLFMFLMSQLPSSGLLMASHQRVTDMSRIKQLSSAMINYEAAHDHFSPAGARGGEGNLSWRVHMLPYLGYDELHQRFKLNESWDSPHNRLLIEEMPEIYASRSYKGRVQSGKTVFLCAVGNGALFPIDGSLVSYKDIPDGDRKTILMVQANATNAVVWTKPSDYIFDPSNPTKGLGGVQPGGTFLASTCKGYTYAVPCKEQDVVALMTRAGNEPPSDFQLQLDMKQP